ncbi:hypothetical protein BSY238_410 [Methyloversatilis sp. RAC08]|uniref:DUF1501 domain-containing protein n=1 Tax=Methyloversatilis sp. RAC08 TaxID=1842540 RepID=UPI000856C191|nr:DUF1501 domain-containing protein [Methyloversatilis sp. RAC08]AOF80891.1 hypothetical protein BSY238_410 [Methyloversatilis sp. RAC08]
MKRREFLRALGLGAIACGSGMPLAHAASDRVLVLVFMRGGWDGLNVVVPHGDDSYYALRPTIAVPAPATGGSSAALDLDGFFGFHSAMTDLWRLYQEGWVAVLPAVHYSNSSRSHFSGQDVIESATTPAVVNGWLARYIQAFGAGDSSRALSFGVKPPLSLMGLPSPASAYQDISGLNLASAATDQTLLSNLIQETYAWPAESRNPNGSALKTVGSNLVPELESLRSIGQAAAGGGAIYPSSVFGRQMRQAAALIKARSGLEIITVDCGGWDTHSNQGNDASGRMGRLLTDFSSTIGAFFQDLGGTASRVTVLTATEFGRTAAENGSLGTDHGDASAWLAMGPNVRGGLHLGSGWPGLGTDQLVDARALRHTVDFRSVYANVLSRFMGASGVGSVLSGYSGHEVDIIA